MAQQLTYTQVSDLPEIQRDINVVDKLMISTGSTENTEEGTQVYESKSVTIQKLLDFMQSTLILNNPDGVTIIRNANNELQAVQAQMIDVSKVTGLGNIATYNIKKCTLDEYNSITHDANTIYFCTEEI